MKNHVDKYMEQEMETESAWGLGFIDLGIAGFVFSLLVASCPSCFLEILA